MIDLEKAKDSFMKYTGNYDSTNPQIHRKIYHSLRVMDNSRYIAESLNLSEEDTEIATLIGLLHDIARFEQIKIYHTTSDAKSIDHGNLGVEILEKNNFIREFIKTDKYDKIIKVAIKNHNKFAIEDGLSQDELLQAKIIRDADKLDILYEGTSMFWSTDEEKELISNSTISDNYFEEFKNKKLILKRPNQTKLDALVLFIAFIFDINFKCSIKEIKKQNFVNIILDRFSYKDDNVKSQIEEIRKIANDYLSQNS